MQYIYHTENCGSLFTKCPMTVINTVGMLIFIDSYFFDYVMIQLRHTCLSAICTIGTDVKKQHQILKKKNIYIYIYIYIHTPTYFSTKVMFARHL